MRKILYGLVAIGLFAFALSTIHEVNSSNQQIHLKKIELKSTELKLKQLEQDYNKLNTDKAKSDAERLRLEKEKADLEAQLQAKAVLKATQKAYAASLPSGYSGCGDNQYANYIYMKESGCRTTAVNSIGCRGIGQACPGDKLPCGDDYACQNAWFTNYAVQRYGSWEGAYNFWLNHSWW